MSALPIALTRYFADSRLTWLSYDESTALLAVRIEKEISGEPGVIRFCGVSYVALPVTFSGEAIRFLSFARTANLFLSHVGLTPEWFDDDAVVYELTDQEGATHYVVAQRLEYEMQK